MLAPVIVDLGPDVGARDVQVVIAACNDAISQGECLPETSVSDAPPRAVAVARAADRSVRVVRIEVRLASDESGPSVVRELVFHRRDPLRERWRSVVLVEPEAEIEPEEAPEVPRAPFEHRSVFIGVGGLMGPGIGDGVLRAGGTLRGAWQGESGLTFGASLGYAWRTSSRDFTAEWLSMEAGVGYRLVASDALSFGALLLGGAQRARFEVLLAGDERSEARWNARAGLEVDGRWRATSGFGVWAAVQASSVGRESRLFVAPERDPIRVLPVDICAAAGLGWWIE